MNKTPIYALRFVGLSAVVLAALGLWYNISGALNAIGDKSASSLSLPFTVMSAVYVLIELLLMFVGIRYINLGLGLRRLFVGLMISECFCIFGLSTLGFAGGTMQTLGVSATVAGGGVFFQFMVGFPLWGPLLAFWAQKRIATAGLVEPDAPAYPREEMNKPIDWIWAAVNLVVMFAVLNVVLSMLLSSFLGLNSAQWFFLWPIAMLLSGLISAVNAWQHVKRQRKRRAERIQKKQQIRLRQGLCPLCEYSLTGLSTARCPECGTTVPDWAILANSLEPTTTE